MTWEELDSKHDYDSSGLIECMPLDVRKEIAKALAGGVFHPHDAIKYVIAKMNVDLDKVDRLYSEIFVKKGCRSLNKECNPKDPESFADFENKLGEEIANRAEVLAAMDCLMHHLKNEDQLKQWTREIVPDEYNWNILDCDPAESAERTRTYMELAKSMNRQRFEHCVYVFACIVRSEAFAECPREGMFSFVSGGSHDRSS